MAYNISDEATCEREIGGLAKFLKAFDGYKGIIITRDLEKSITVEGKEIQAIPVYNWLISGDLSTLQP